MLSLITAMSADRVIGNKGKIPWHLPEDFKLFRQLTLNKGVIMGSKTFESLPLKDGIPGLPGRANIVVTSDPKRYEEQSEKNPRLWFCTSLEEAIHMLSPDKEAFIIGGASIYAQAFPLVQKAYLSMVCGKWDGDAFFPDVDWSDWRISAEDQQYPGFTFRTMERI